MSGSGLAAIALLTVALSTGAAVAGSMITGKQIKNGTVTSADIRDRTIRSADLAEAMSAPPGAVGAPGVTGPQGPPGVVGPQGPRGLAAWEQIPHGTTVADIIEWDQSTTGATGLDVLQINLPGLPSRTLGADQVNFAPVPGSSAIADADPACAGSYLAPTAPAGKVCIYLNGSLRLSVMEGRAFGERPTPSFLITYRPSTAQVGADAFLSASWAYTAA